MKTIFRTDAGQRIEVYRSTHEPRVWLRIETRVGVDSIGYRRKDHRALRALAAAITAQLDACEPATRRKKR